MPICECHKLDECHCNSGLPQTRLRELASQLEATADIYFVHDIVLARFLADALDQPRRDASMKPVLITAEHLILDMQSHLREVENA